MVERTLIRPPPCSLLGSSSSAKRKAVLDKSEFAGRYGASFDRESAFEKLQQRIECTPMPAVRGDDE